MPLVSVIIPVYKVEKYLNQCVDSIINQHLDDIEVILVDDGSPDNSPEICDDYAEKYDYIRVIHKENGGASSARNAGMKEAKGDYLMFADSDDWWNPEIDAGEVLNYAKSRNNIDMFLFKSLDYYDGKGYFKRKDHDDFDNISTESVEAYYQSLVNNGNFEVSACTKIVKSKVVFDNNLYFKEGSTGEDNEWMMRLLRTIKSVDIINKELYICRCDRAESVTHTLTAKNICDMLNIVKSSIEFYDKNKEEEVYCLKDKELSFASYLWFSSLGLTYAMDKQDKKSLRPLFMATKSVCTYSTSKKTKICNMLLSVFGFRATTFLLGMYLRYKDKYIISKSKV